MPPDLPVLPDLPGQLGLWVLLAQLDRQALLGRPAPPVQLDLLVQRVPLGRQVLPGQLALWVLLVLLVPPVLLALLVLLAPLALLVRLAPRALQDPLV